MSINKDHSVLKSRLLIQMQIQYSGQCCSYSVSLYKLSMIRFSSLFRKTKINTFHPKTLAQYKHPLRSVNNFWFTEQKKNGKEDEQKNGQKEISLADTWQWLSKTAQNVYSEVKKMNKWYLGFMLTLPLIYYLTKKDEAQEYAINYFEQELSQNSSAYNELHVKIYVSQKIPTYKVYFDKDDRKYFVSFRSNSKRLRTILQKTHKSTKVTFEYIDNYEIKLSLPIIIAEIISVVFMAAFFTQTGRMNTGVKGGSGSNIYQKLLGQKKAFDVIQKTNVKFQDVAGLDQSKLEVQEFVDFLKNPDKYKKLGARIPKGVMLSGPPGTGKTMLAKAVAGEAGVPFIPTSGSDFVQIFVGVGASRVRELFQTARQKSPAIIFIDQIDAVGRKRSGSHGSHDERDNTLNQILVEMDGFGTDSNVIVMAATNRLNLLDTALIRPGRFDRMVEVNLPDLQGRRQIFNVHLKKIVVDPTKTKDQYARRLASLTPGFSGAEIANLCNEAALLAARNNKEFVDAHDFQMATERLIGGIEKKGIVSNQQKKIVSIHQSGHAVVSWFLQGADPLLKLTIIPRSKGSLGFAQYFNNQNKLNTKSQLIDQICFILGGRCAEEYFFGTSTNGAADDLQKVYKIAHSIVTKLGMNDKIGYVGFRNTEYLRPYSEQMGAEIDRQILNIIAECTARTKQMVKKHHHLIKKLSDELYEKQTLTIKEIRRILGERQFKNHQTYNSYLQVEKQMQKS